MSVESVGIGKTKHLSEGGDLGQLISDTIDNGYTSIHIHAKDDGSDWSWDTDVRYDTDQEGELEIVVADNATIDYTGDTRPMWVEDTNTSGEDFGGENQFRLVGGRWTASGSPNQWLRIDDQVGYRVMPRFVDYQGTGATCLEVRNVHNFSELGVIEGTYKGGNGINFVPASVTGGTGTGSFQGTTIRDVRINHFANNTSVDSRSGDGFGIWLRGNMRYCTIRRPNIFPNGDASHAIRYDATTAKGSVISGFQAEASSGSSETVGVIASSNNNGGCNAPVFIGGEVSGSTTYKIYPDSATGTIPRIYRLSQNGERLAIDAFGEQRDSVTYDNRSGDLSAGQLSTNGVTIDSTDGITFTDVFTILKNNTCFEFSFEDPNSNGFNWQANGSKFAQWGQNGSNYGVDWAQMALQDVRNISSPSRGYTAYHDGSGSNTEGPAFYNGSNWVSVVDGSTIS